MRKSAIGIVVSLLVAAGGWFFFKNFTIDGLDKLNLSPRDGTVATGGAQSTSGPMLTAPPVQRQGDTIRIASFNIQVFGNSKSQKPHVMERLATIVRQFDVVAIQEIRTKDNGHLPRFLDLINATGRHYDFVIGPRLGRSHSKEQYAFIYDAQSLEIDRQQLYTVNDPDDLLHREPLVGWFRVRGPNTEEAFTFTLVNIHTDPDETDQELDVLAQVFNVVQADGRMEDDVIVLGDLNVDERHLGALGRLPNVAYCISGIPTNVTGTKTYDNLIYNSAATVEFTGRAGVFDFMRQYDLTLEEAKEISDHIPVWAEFSVYERGVPGRLATRPQNATQ